MVAIPLWFKLVIDIIFGGYILTENILHILFATKSDDGMSYADWFRENLKKYLFCTCIIIIVNVIKGFSYQNGIFAIYFTWAD